MPYIFEKEKIKIKKEDDRRIKLTEDDKEEIRKLYKTGMYSQRQLATMFNVSRRSIQFAVNPDSYQKSLEQFKERQKDGRYYNKDAHTKYVREYRQRKKELYDLGELV